MKTYYTILQWLIDNGHRVKEINSSVPFSALKYEITLNKKDHKVSISNTSMAGAVRSAWEFVSLNDRPKLHKALFCGEEIDILMIKTDGRFTCSFKSGLYLVYYWDSRIERVCAVGGTAVTIDGTSVHHLVKGGAIPFDEGKGYG